MIEAPARCAQCGARLLHGTPGDLCPLCVPDGEAAPPARVLGDCELSEEIGRGGMGVVWRGRQRGLDREVAVKMLPGGDLAGAEARARFQQEAKATARLKHPNIVAIHEVGEADGVPFLVMELIEGSTLSSALQEQPVIARQAARWLREAALAVQHAHDHGVLHRDLKPSNILIEPWEGGGRPRVTDFGLAKMTDADAGLTLSGAAAGSPAFMAPEQARGEEAAVAGDVYGLGAVLYFTLTGRAPFQGETVAAVLAQVGHDEPLAPRRLNASVPRDLETICLKALEKNPARRYASARLLADDLGRFLGGEPVAARPITAAEKLWRLARRKPWHAAAAALAAALLGGVIFSLAWRARTERQHQAELRAEQAAAQLALLRAQLGEARAIVRLRQPDSRLRAAAIVRKILDAQPPAALRQEARDVAASALALPAAKTVALPGGGVVTDDWTMAAGDLARGRWALASYQGRVALRGVDDAGEVASFDTAPRVVTALIGFSPGGRWLAIRHREELGIWDLTPGSAKPLAFVAAPWADGRVFSFAKTAFAPGDSTVLWSDGGSVIATSLPAGKEMARWRGKDGSPLRAEALAFDPAGQWCALARADEPVVELRRWPEGGIAQSYAGFFSQPLAAVALSEEAERIAGGDPSGGVMVWERAGGRESLIEFRGHTAAIRGLAFSPDGRWLASTSEDGMLRVWDCAAAAEVAALPFDAAVVTFAGDGRKLGVGVAAGRLSWAGVEPSPCLHRFRPARAPEHAQQMSFFPDGRSLVCLSRDGAVRCAVPGGETLAVYPFAGPHSVLAEPSGAAVLVSGPSGVARFAVAEDGTAPGGANGPEPGPPPAAPLFPSARWGWDALTASADGRWLAASDNAGARVAVWPAGDKDSRRAHFLPMENGLGSGPVALSPDGARAAAALRYDAGLAIYNTGQEIPLRKFSLPPRHRLAWSPDGRWLAASGSTAALWDAAAWQPVKLPPLAPNHPPAGAAAFAWPEADGRSRLLSCVVGDTRLALLSLPDAAVRLTLEPPEARPIYQTAFSPDQRWLAAASVRGEISLWDLPALFRGLCSWGFD